VGVEGVDLLVVDADEGDDPLVEDVDPVWWVDPV